MKDTILSVFITHASNIIGETNNGISGSTIAKLCSAYAIVFAKKHF